MRKTIFYIVFSLLPMLAIGQFRIVGTGLFTKVNDSTYTAAIQFRPDLTGNAYNPTKMVSDSMYVLSQRGQLYVLDTFWNATLSSANVTIVEHQGNWGSPIGQVMVFRNNSSVAAPQAVYSANGATAPMQAGVDTWNSLLLKVVSDSAVYWNEAYSKSIDSISVSGDSLKIISLYRANGDTLTASFVDSSGGGGVTMPLDSITFTTTAENTALEGELTYNNQSGTLVLGMAGGIEIPVGQGEAHIVRNSTGATIQKGKVVYISGATGQRPQISLSDADTEVGSSVTFGITAEAIAANDSGFVFTSGYIKGINTNSLTEGEALWLDTIPGGFTHTKPTAPVNSVLVGYVITKKNNGTIFVKIQNGYEIDELHNVVTAGKVNNSVIRYDSATALWKASTTAGIVAGDTAAMLTNYINIADTATMLSSYISNADTSVFARDFQISGTSGQVTYFNGANTVTGDANLTWSAANRTLGINTTTTSGANIIIKNTQEPVRDAAWLPNQTFGADTTNWTRGAGWTFNGTQAVATAATGALTYTTLPDTIISGRAYEVTYTLASYSAGTVTVALGNATLALPQYNVTGNAVLLLPTSATGGFRFTTSTFTGRLDNISVVEVRNAAPIVLAGQDDGAATLYNPIRMPNATSLIIGGGGSFSTNTTNLIFGENAGSNITTAGSNLFVGRDAGRNTTNGFSNFFFGDLSGAANTTGFSNNFIGNQAGNANTLGSSNNFIGNQAGLRNTTGSKNTYIGEFAGRDNTTGQNNIFIGENSGLVNRNGNENIFFGRLAGVRSNTASQSIYIGLLAGSIVTSGSKNTIIGTNAAYSETTADTVTGGNNTIIGTELARNIAGSANGNLVLGNSNNLPTANGSNQVVIKNLIFGTGASGTGTTIQTTAKAGINVNNPQSTLDVEGNMAIGATYSGTTAAPTNGLIVEGNTGIGTSSPQRRLHITGTVRVDTLTRDVPTRIVGADADGDLAAVTLGTGLSIASGTLNGPSVSGTTNYLPKFTGASSIGNSLFFDNGTQTMIGGTNPAFNISRFSIYYNAQTHGAPILVDTRAYNSPILPGGSWNIGGQYDSLGTYASFAAFAAKKENSNNLDTKGEAQIFVNNGGDIFPDEAIRIKSDGKVGIGTTTPSERLSILRYNSGTTNAGIVSSFLGNSVYSTVGHWAGLALGTAYKKAGIFAYDGYNNFGRVDLVFAVASGGDVNDVTLTDEKMRILNNGRVGIGTTSPSRTLHVEGEARISDLTTDTPTRIVGADADGDLGAITLGTGLSISSGTLNASGITSVYIPINLFSPGDTVTNTTNAKNFFLVHSGLNGYCIDSYTVKAIAGTGTADIQVDKNDTGGNLQAISGTTVYTKDTNIALVTGDYIRGQVFNISGTLIGLGLTLEIKATCN